MRQDHLRLVKMIPHLVERLNAGLMLTRYPSEPIAIFLDEHSALHDRVLDEHRRAVANAVKLRAPTLIIVGEVVTLRDKLRWFAEDGK